MNVVIYAGDNKYTKTLLPIVRELRNRDINYFFMFSDATLLKVPINRDEYWYDTNDRHLDNLNSDIRYNWNIQSDTLGISLPFKPDWLILARERWQPEQSIIHEFKTKFNSKIGCVEVSSHILNNIENRLEMYSRQQYPQNLIDYFFEHSEYARQRRIDCMDSKYLKKSIVTGNPRFIDITTEPDKCIQKYNIDKTKKQILFWGVINTTRKTALKALQVLAEKTKDTHQIFYKPYPGEPYNPRFYDQFNPNFLVSNVQVIYDEDDTFSMAELCDIHIGAFSSVFNFAFYFNKVLVNLDSVCNVSFETNNLYNYFNEVRNGVEDSALFWMNIWKLKTYDEFKELVGLDRLKRFDETNQYVLELLKHSTLSFDWECNFLSYKQEYSSEFHRKELIKLFDQFSFDGKAAKRIVDFITNTEI